MGFWGSFVVHRGEQLLADLMPGVEAFGEAALCYDGVAGGWQVTRVFARDHPIPTGLLTDLRTATEAPVLAAYILDSDAAFVDALGQLTPGWQAWLGLDGALAHLVPSPPPFDEDGNYLGDDWSDPDHEREVAAIRERTLAETPGGSAAAAAAVAWAAEAGLEPGTPEEIAALLDGKEVFVEDLFFALLNRLGLDTVAVEPPVRPGIADVLRSLLGRRVRAVHTTPHRPTRAERLAFADMEDMRISLENGPTVIACGCAGEFSLLPAMADEDPTAASPEGKDESLTRAMSEIVGQQLTDATTIRHRFLPDVLGVVLRFNDNDLFIATVDGQWTIQAGATPPAQLRNEVHVNAWLTA